MELVHEEERVGCKKISVGVYILKNTHEEGHGYLWEKKNISAYEKKKNDENERKRMRKRGRKRHDEMLKVRMVDENTSEEIVLH